ncbi:MAG: hypothetical protein AB7E80_12790 [Hyphomicrobiaceae bacterium]
MRLKSILAALMALVALAVAVPQTADAGGFHRHRAPEGWGRERVVRHWVFYPRYTHVYYRHSVTDPYAYRYVQPRYYPYYNSRYWVPARCYSRCKPHYRLPRYHASWGYPGKRRHHHHRHHRHHRHW